MFSKLFSVAVLMAVVSTAAQGIPPGWNSIGCVSDSPSRALLGYSFTDYQLTRAGCLNACASKGFTIAGLEDGAQCWCDNKFKNGQGEALASSSCNVQCSGDSSSKCGGSWTMNAFVYTPPSPCTAEWSGMGCVSDGTARALTGYSFTDYALTPQVCFNICESKGFSIAGLEDGAQCWCGNSFEHGLGKPSTACNVPCSGDSSRVCGGSWAIDAYKLKLVCPTSTVVTSTTSVHSTTSTTVSTSTTSVYSTSTTVSTTTSAAQPSSTCWNSVGCVSDGPARALTEYSFSDNQLTPAECLTACASNGYAIAGLEYSSQCFCGNSFDNGLGQPIASSSCNMTCAGDNNSICGGPWALDAYTLNPVCPTSTGYGYAYNSGLSTSAASSATTALPRRGLKALNFGREH